MADTVYFSKIEYCEVIGYGNTTSIMLLNIPEQELSYQVYDWKRQMPAIEGMQTKEINKYTWTYDIAFRQRKSEMGKQDSNRNLSGMKNITQKLLFLMRLS